MAGDAAVEQREAGERLVDASLLLGRQRVTADELGVEVDREADAGLVRRSRVLLGVEVLAGEEQPLLHPEGVPGAQPAGLAVERRPDRLGVVGVTEDLDAVLAGVARPGDQTVGAGDGRLGGGEPREVGEVVALLSQGRADGLDGVGGEADRVGPLHREHRPVRGLVGDLGVEPVRVAVVDPAPLGLLVVARVGDKEVPTLGEAVRHRVVVDDPVLVGDAGVLGVARLHRGDVVGRESLHQGLGVGALDADLTHVRHVEDPGGLPDGGVFGPDGVELHGHLPAAEVGEPRAAVLVDLVQRWSPCGHTGTVGGGK
ncbi:hypothetical protein SY89_00858 [Halolamina pelagica]|uniref:Uncharacterized protein n=1 Tax=Halolamina pelagica TaxID=699431 RepID=A0A0P7G9W4_9EURY|nr:hypothetical protein SY89_00858 [Halolamina pelagica]